MWLHAIFRLFQFGRSVRERKEIQRELKDELLVQQGLAQERTNRDFLLERDLRELERERTDHK
ncbi:MAG TPA: hypothetical protein VMV94_19850 [Phycisphaerae bacterium]|nr:hypothetical protein [Phycisphaerae bacterium]